MLLRYTVIEHFRERIKKKNYEQKLNRLKARFNVNVFNTTIILHKINEIVHRICGNSGGATFTKQNLGPTNIMIVRFDSDRYKTISPGSGFILSVTATPSGNV